MDAIEKRAQERARFDAWVKASGSYSWNGFNRMEDMWDAWQAALTPPEGYVLVPTEVQRDADRFRFLASWAGAEFNPDRGYLRWYLSRKGRGFASLAETVDQCLSSARPEVKP